MIARAFVLILVLALDSFGQANLHPSKWAGCMLWVDADGDGGLITRDKSAFARTGTLTNGAALTTSGATFAGYNFGSVNNAVFFPHDTALNNNLSALTISAWVYDNKTTYWCIATKWGGAGNYPFVIYKYFPTATNLSVFIGGTRSDINLRDACTNRWVHLVVTFSDTANQVCGYQDGVLLGCVANAGTPLTNTAPYYIGTDTGGNSAIGRMDSFGLFNRVLTAREVNQLYTAGHP